MQGVVCTVVVYDTEITDPADLAQIVADHEKQYEGVVQVSVFAGGVCQVMDAKDQNGDWQSQLVG